MAEPATGDEGSGRSWWTTLPGILTGIAAVLTAVTGMIVALSQLRSGSSVGGQPPTATIVPTAEPTVSTSPPAETRAAAAPYRVTFPSGKKATIGTAVYEVARARVETSNPGDLALRLTVRLTNNGDYDANFWDASFRLRVDGLQRAPTSFLDDVVAARTAGEGEVVFSVPATARKLTLLVGDREPRVSLPVALSAR
jgi:hypothetical protein